jgi:hypothetical protein
MSCGLAVASAVTVEEPGAAKADSRTRSNRSVPWRESFPLWASERSQLGVSRESS